MQEPCAIFVLFSHSRSLFLPAKLGHFEVPSKKQHYALREQNEPHGRDVHVPNRRNGERGTNAAGSGEGGVGSGKRVERVAVMGEREAGKVGRAEANHAASRPAMLFLSFVLNFYFLKKRRRRRSPSISSSDYQYDEYHQYH